MNTPTQLFTAVTADGNSAKIHSTGGFVTLLAKGTWGSGTIRIQASPDAGTTWIDTDAVLTADGVINFIAGDGVDYRLSLTGSTGANLNAWVAYEK